MPLLKHTLSRESVLVKFTKSATLAQKEAWKKSITALPASIPQIKDIIHGNKYPHPLSAGWDDGLIHAVLTRIVINRILLGRRDYEVR